MFETFRNAWKIEDLRKRLLFTLLVIVVFRLGCSMPVPFIAPTALQSMVTSSGSLLGYIDMLTGGSFSRATLFALSVTPYINSSIIIQLLTVAIPALERLSKEGESGRKKSHASPVMWVQASRLHLQLDTTSCFAGRALLPTQQVFLLCSRQ